MSGDEEHTSTPSKPVEHDAYAYIPTNTETDNNNDEHYDGNKTDPTDWIEPLLARENVNKVQNPGMTASATALQVPVPAPPSRAVSEKENWSTHSIRPSTDQHDDVDRLHRGGASSSSSMTTVSARSSLQMGSNPFRARMMQQQPQPHQKQDDQADGGGDSEEQRRAASMAIGDALSLKAERLSIRDDESGFGQTSTAGHNQQQQQLTDQTNIETIPQASLNYNPTATTTATAAAPQEQPLPHSSSQEPLPSTSKPTSAPMISTTQQPPWSSVGQDTEATASQSTTAPVPSTSTSTPTHPTHTTTALSKSQEEQRKETYAIRHIIWKRTTSSPAQNVSILVQNENGPCPLLALVNAIVLRTKPTVKSPVAKALEHRERISLGLLIQALLEELLNTMDEELPDIADLGNFLTMLHTGMNVNPCLMADSDLDPKSGYFQNTTDVNLYSSFGVPLVHGWLAPPQSETASSLQRTKATYYEDIELLEIESDTFTDRILRGEELSPAEEMRMLDIERILRFTKVENATQISEFGLERLRDALQPGSISVLFRNNHFATLYKHPEMKTLFVLVSDAGFASRKEVVWESLDDVRGSRTRFFSGDFLPVGGENAGGSSSGAHAAATTATSALISLENQDPNVKTTEQEDADYAYALQLRYQEEEEAARRRQSGSRSSRSGRTPREQQQQQQSRGRGSGAPRPPPPTYEQSRFDRRLVSKAEKARRRESRRAGAGGREGDSTGTNAAAASSGGGNAAGSSAPSTAQSTGSGKGAAKKKDDHGCSMM